MERFYVIDGFKMMGDETLYHVKRIASMCKGVRFPCGYGHDGNVNARGAGTTTADVYRRLGAPMLGKYPTNSDGKNNHVEPEIMEIIKAMKAKRFIIASHMTELAEEILHYHRTEEQDQSNSGRPDFGHALCVDVPQPGAPVGRMRLLPPRTGHRQRRRI